MKKEILPFLAISFLGTAAWAQSPSADEHDRELYRAYEACVIEKAEELEPSGETAREIVNAAIAACDDQRTEVWAAITANLIVDNPGGLTSLQRRLPDATMKKIDERMAPRVALTVMEKRASRKAD